MSLGWRTYRFNRSHYFDCAGHVNAVALCGLLVRRRALTDEKAAQCSRCREALPAKEKP